jgi:hypothetical protein
MRKRLITVVCGAAAALAMTATASSASTITLTFEGLKDQEQILDFYNGGTGSAGSSGTDYGISFGNSALALIDSDAGGNGNFANEPSPSTIAFFNSGGDLVMNVPAGFTTGFSFFYTAAFPGSVAVYDGLNATGTLLGTVPLSAQSSSCGAGGDPTGSAYACWDPIGVAFAGTAKSVSFAGAAAFIGFDNITLGAASPVPEPASLTMLGVGLAGAAIRRRRAQKV